MGMGKGKPRVKIKMSHQHTSGGDCRLLRCNALPGGLPLA
jgi:hypothetical protein